MPRRRKKFPIKLVLKPETIQSIAAVVLIAMGVLVMFSFSNQGQILRFINTILREKFGLTMLYFPFLFFSGGMVLFRARWTWSKLHILLGGCCLMIANLILFKTGSIGKEVFFSLQALITPAGTIVASIALAISGALIITQSSIADILENISIFISSRTNKTKESFVFNDGKNDSSKDKDVDDSEQKGMFGLPKLNLGFGHKKTADSTLEDGKKLDMQGNKSAVNDKNVPELEKKLVKLALTDKPGMPQKPGDSSVGQEIWDYPPLSLLSNKGGGSADRGDVKKNASIIENTLSSFGIKAAVKEANFGPAVTQYALEITQGTKLSKITGLSTDLALALAAPTGQIRIEAPIAGKSLVGVEVPNYSAQFVTLRDMLQSQDMKKLKSKLAVALGIGVSGEHMVANIAKMPHLLIAGSTGSGKSVAINAFLCSILFRASPDEVKLILVDPKRVELTGYNDIPHLLTPVIVEPSKVVSALKWATNEMEQRYKKLAEVGVKNIDDYNELAGLAAMPSIVIVIDELADIMLFAPSEVEECITRIAQMARAVGIHLVLATQRPSVDVITGLIKANIPTRIAFNVSSVTDSRVILDNPGAEKLLGRGDMLYLPPDRAKPIRIQGTYVDDGEIRQLIDFLKSQGHRPSYQEEITTKFKGAQVKGGSGNMDGEERDAFFNDAAKLFTQYDKASSSMIQRRMAVGYARAARILDQLYAAGFVGPADGSKPREINTGKLKEYLSSIESVDE